MYFQDKEAGLRVIQTVLALCSFLICTALTRVSAGSFALVLTFVLTTGLGIHYVFVIQRKRWVLTRLRQLGIDSFFLALFVIAFLAVSSSSDIFTCDIVSCTWATLGCLVLGVGILIHLGLLYLQYIKQEELLVTTPRDHHFDEVQTPVEIQSV